MKKLLITVCAVLAAGAMARPAQAQVAVGPELSFADDWDFGIGARAQFDLGSLFDAEGLETLQGVASFDYFFPECVDCSYWEINGNALYPFELDGDLAPYAGGGLNISRRSIGTVSDTDAGLNLLGGLDFALEGFTMFTEAKIEIGGGNQFVLTVGALFGG